MRLTDELESVSDEAATILKVTRRLRKGGQTFSESSIQVILRVLIELDILNAYERVRAYYLNIAETLRRRSTCRHRTFQ